MEIFYSVFSGYLTEAMLEERFDSFHADYPEVEIAKLKESCHLGNFFAITADKSHEVK